MIQSPLRSFNMDETGLCTCTSAGFFHVNEFVAKPHDFRIILLTCISQEVEQRLLQISWFGVTKLKQENINLVKCHCPHCRTGCSCGAGGASLFSTLHRYDMEKPKAFPLREPEFIKLPKTRMISRSCEKFWLLTSSSHAAVTDTTSGLMLFSCSSNCSLNRMASSRTFSCFTVDIWQGWRRRDTETHMKHILSIDEHVLREKLKGIFFFVNTHFV